STARRRACARDSFRCRRIVSTSCAPMVNSGWRLVSGSWKMAPIRLPRIFSSSRSDRLSMRWPPRRISPSAIWPGGSISPSVARPVIDLPAPDSPTTPSISPLRIVSDTSDTALTVPVRVGKATRRLRTYRTGASMVASSCISRATCISMSVFLADSRVARPEDLGDIRMAEGAVRIFRDQPVELALRLRLRNVEVDAGHLPVAHRQASIDEHRPDDAPRTRHDERLHGVEAGSGARSRQIEHRDIGLAARGEAADIVALQRPRPA